jgi:5-methyltetrahydropteroyltriglutamate--homocysteine methyltransferase
MPRFRWTRESRSGELSRGSRADAWLGNYEGPHTRYCVDEDFPIIRRPSPWRSAGCEPGAHEWEVWKTYKLPADKILCRAVFTSSFVEHPEVVAQRIVRYAG